MARFRETRALADESSPFVLVVLFWFIVVAAVLGATSLGLYAFYAPARVAIDNRVFHNSQPYQDGMARDLENMRMAYMQADEPAKGTIRATIQHRFAGYDASTLPPDLQAFLQQVRQ